MDDNLRLTIETERKAHTKLNIITSSGQLISNQRMVEGENEISIGNLSPGLYFYTILSSSGEAIFSDRFIKQ